MENERETPFGVGYVCARIVVTLPSSYCYSCFDRTSVVVTFDSNKHDCFDPVIVVDRVGYLFDEWNYFGIDALFDCFAFVVVDIAVVVVVVASDTVVDLDRDDIVVVVVGVERMRVDVRIAVTCVVVVEMMLMMVTSFDVVAMIDF